MNTIRSILNAKPSELWSVGPDDTVFRALELMAEKDVGALPVLDGKRVVGIFSERDYARKVVLKGRASRQVPVKELMSAPVHTVSPKQTIQDAMAVMTEKRVRHLPVVEDGELIGIVTIGDVVKKIISEQGQTIEELENYIQGNPGPTGTP